MSLNTDNQNFSETTLSSEIVYSGVFLKVYKDTVRLPAKLEKNDEAVREYIKHPGAAMIIALDSDDKFIMIKQFRYPLKKVFIEFPAGKIDPGEDSLDTAKREFLEETGYQAKNWRFLTQIHPVIGYADEKIDIYLAQDLTAGEKKLDHGEHLQIFKTTEDELLELAKNNQLTDVKTLSGLLWYLRFGKNK